MVDSIQSINDKISEIDIRMRNLESRLSEYKSCMGEVERHKKEIKEKSWWYFYLSIKDYINEKDPKLARRLKKLKRQGSGINMDIEELERDQLSRGYLNSILRTADSRIYIGKELSHIFGNKADYSLWADNSPVLFYLDNNLQYVFSTRKDDPLRINTVIQGIMEQIQPAIERAKERVSFEEGDFITLSGIPIIGDNENYAVELYRKIFQGIIILPRPETEQGYSEKVDRTREESEIRYRHWGQVYISQLGPAEVRQGEVLGSGGSYKAFQFGEKLIVEFDQEDRATYLFDANSFDRLRVVNRADLIANRPEGFNGRVIHHENRDSWKKNINQFLGIDRQE